MWQCVNLGELNTLLMEHGSERLNRLERIFLICFAKADFRGFMST